MKHLFLAFLLLCSNAFGAITDLKLSTAQIFDVQWNISGGRLNASGFNYIYASVNYATQTNSAARWTLAQTQDANSNGRYIGFFNSTTNPGTYGMAVFNSDGSRYKIINNTGSFRALADGAIFYNGNGMWGTLITTKQGYTNGQSGNWAVTQDNPTNSQLQAYMPPSSTPLASGQTAAPPQPVVSMKPIFNNSSNLYTTNIVPTSYNSPGGEGAANAFDNNPNTKYLNFDKKNAGVTIKLNQGRVISGFKLTTANDFSGRDPTSYKLYASNDGKTWTKLGEGALSLTEARYTVSDMITVANTQPYFYYFIYFPTTKSGDGCGLNCDSMQIADITYFYDENNSTSSVDATPSGGTIANPGTPGSTAPGMGPEWPATSDITSNQLASKNSAKNRVAGVGLGNSLYLEQKSGSSNNSVNIEQTGFYNSIGGLAGTQYAVINGSSNTLNIKQGDGNGRNLMEFSIVGNSNTVTLWQARNPSTGLQDGGESGGHYTGLNVTGSSNTVAIKQGNNGGLSSGHVAFMDVTGSGNTGSLRQSNDGEKVFFGVVSGSNNVFEVLQQGTSTGYFDLMLSGNGHTVSANQKDSGAHKATVNLTNAGGASSVTLVQQGSTAQNINITQQCATLSGCSVTVTQGQ
jgi:hypothetical protein